MSRKVHVYYRWLRRRIRNKLVGVYVAFCVFQHIQRVVDWLAGVLDSMDIYKMVVKATLGVDL